MLDCIFYLNASSIYSFFYFLLITDGMICFVLYFVLCGLEFDPRPWLFSLFSGSCLFSCYPIFWIHPETQLEKSSTGKR